MYEQYEPADIDERKEKPSVAGRRASQTNLACVLKVLFITILFQVASLWHLILFRKFSCTTVAGGALGCCGATSSI